MILFCDSNGTIQKNLGSPVYQGSANSNIIYLIAPYAPSASVLAAFQLPDGTAIAPVAMTPQSSVPGVQNADGTTFAGWSYVLPGSVTAKYGTVSAQFYFYAPTGTSIIATASTSFQVGRGVAAILPDTPDADVYESILSNIAQLQTDLTGGYYAARAIYAWNSSYTYGSNEITFYPVGNYGAFVKSLVNRNTQQPYTSAGVLNSNWAEVANFNTIAEDFYTEIQTAVQQAQTAQAGAEAARAAAVASAENAQAAKNEALVAAADAQKHLEDVNEAKDQVSDYRDEVETAIIYIRNMGLEIAQDVTNAENSASAAAQSAGQSAQSALQAQEYAQQAQEYAQKHYEIVASYDALPQPGNSAYIYLVPSSTESGADNYEEYLWITNTSSYEFIGTTSDVDLSNYAKVNGTYSGMTVGNAINASSLDGVAASNYAQIDGSYPNFGAGYLAKEIILSNGASFGGYFKVCSFTSPKTATSNSFIFLINGIYGDQSVPHAEESGIIELDVRSNNDGVISSISGLTILAGNLNSTEFFVLTSADLSTIDFYIYIPQQYGSLRITELSASDRAKDVVFDGTRYSTAPEGAVYAVVRNNASYADQAGNAATATDSEKLGGNLASFYAPAQSVKKIYKHSFVFSYGYGPTAMYAVSFDIFSSRADKVTTYAELLEMWEETGGQASDMIPASGDVLNTNHYPIVALSLSGSVYYLTNTPVSLNSMGFQQATVHSNPLEALSYTVQEIQ